MLASHFGSVFVPNEICSPSPAIQSPNTLLSDKGKKAYFIGLFAGIALFAVFFFGLADYTMETGRSAFITGLIVINVIWAAACYIIWKKDDDHV